MLAKKSRHFAIGSIILQNGLKPGCTIMELLVYVCFLLPVLIAFIVLWYFDAALIQKFENSFMLALIEVGVAMLIIAIGEAIIFYFLFNH